MADAEIVPRAQPLDQPGLVRRPLKNALCRVVNIREVISARGQKPPDFRDRIVGILTARP